MACYKHRRRILNVCLHIVVFVRFSTTSNAASQTSSPSSVSSIVPVISSEGSALSSSIQDSSLNSSASLSTSDGASIGNNATTAAALSTSNFKLPLSFSHSASATLIQASNELKSTRTLSYVATSPLATSQSDNRSINILQSTTGIIRKTLLSSSTHTSNIELFNVSSPASILDTSSGEITRTFSDSLTMLSSSVQQKSQAANFTQSTNVAGNQTASSVTLTNKTQDSSLEVKILLTSLAVAASSSVMSHSSQPVQSENLRSTTVMSLITESLNYTNMASQVTVASNSSSVPNLSLTAMKSNAITGIFESVSTSTPIQTSRSGHGVVIQSTKRDILNVTTSLSQQPANSTSTIVPLDSSVSRTANNSVITQSKHPLMVVSSGRGSTSAISIKAVSTRITSPLSLSSENLQHTSSAASKQPVKNIPAITSSISVLVSDSQHTFGMGSKELSTTLSREVESFSSLTLSSKTRSITFSLFHASESFSVTPSASVLRSTVMPSPMAPSTDLIGPSSLTTNPSATPVSTGTAVSKDIFTSVLREAVNTSSDFIVQTSLTVVPSAVTTTTKLIDRSTLTAATTATSLADHPVSSSASVTPRNTSVKDMFIVTSYSTPCYIYYVVEKTVTSVTTANQSLTPGTRIPSVTLDIGSATSLSSGLPTVTVTHSSELPSTRSETKTPAVALTRVSLSVLPPIMSSMPLISMSMIVHPSLSSESVSDVLSTDTLASKTTLSVPTTVSALSASDKLLGSQGTLSSTQVIEVPTASKQSVVRSSEPITASSNFSSSVHPRTFKSASLTSSLETLNISATIVSVTSASTETGTSIVSSSAHPGLFTGKVSPTLAQYSTVKGAGLSVTFIKSDSTAGSNVAAVISTVQSQESLSVTTTGKLSQLQLSTSPAFSSSLEQSISTVSNPPVSSTFVPFAPPAKRRRRRAAGDGVNSTVSSYFLTPVVSTSGSHSSYSSQMPSQTIMTGRPTPTSVTENPSSSQVAVPSVSNSLIENSSQTLISDSSITNANATSHELTSVPVSISYSQSSSQTIEIPQISSIKGASLSRTLSMEVSTLSVEVTTSSSVPSNASKISSFSSIPGQSVVHGSARGPASTEITPSMQGSALRSSPSETLLSSASSSQNLHDSSVETSSSMAMTVSGHIASTHVSPSKALEASGSQRASTAKTLTLVFPMENVSSSSVQKGSVISSQMQSSASVGEGLTMQISQSLAPVFNSTSISEVTSSITEFTVISSTQTSQNNETASIATTQVPSSPASVSANVLELSSKPSLISVDRGNTTFASFTVMVNSSGVLDSSASALVSSPVETLESSTIVDKSTPATASYSVTVQHSSMSLHSNTVTGASYSLDTSHDGLSSPSRSDGPSASFTVPLATVQSSVLGQSLGRSQGISLSPSLTSESSGYPSLEVTSKRMKSASLMGTTEIVGTSSTLSPTAFLSSQGISHSPHTDGSRQTTMMTPALTSASSMTVLSSRNQSVVITSVRPDQSSTFKQNFLVTLSSLGICYVVYTTRVVQPTLEPSPTSTLTSVPANSTSLAIKATSSVDSSSVVVLPSLTVNASSAQTSQIVLITVNITVEPSLSLSVVSSRTTVLVVNVNSVSPPAFSSVLTTRRSELSFGPSVASQSSLLPSVLPSKVGKTLTTSLSSRRISMKASFSSTEASSFSTEVSSSSTEVSSSSTEVSSSNTEVSSPSAKASLSRTKTSSASSVSSSSDAIVSKTPLVVTSTTKVSQMPTSGVTSSTNKTASQERATEVVGSTLTTTAKVLTSDTISPTSSAHSAATSSVFPSTQIPISEALMHAQIVVSSNEDIQTNEFTTKLAGTLAEAYLLGEKVSAKRRRRATDNIKVTVNDSKRIDNSENVDVLFFVTKNNQRLRSVDAVKPYDALTGTQLGTLINYEVIQKPVALVGPATVPPPSHAVVSVLIKDFAENNVSIPENKQKLETKLAGCYKERKGLSSSSDVEATISTILREPNDVVYLEFFITVDGTEVNQTDVVKTFEVSNVNILTAKLEVQVLVPVYVPDSLTASRTDYVIIGIHVIAEQDLGDFAFRNDLADKLARVYQTGKGKTSSRKRRAVGSISATIVNVTRASDDSADATFFIFDAGNVVNASYASTVMNRLSTVEMTQLSAPYAILSAPNPAYVTTTETGPPPTVSAIPIRWWIIPAVLCPIVLIIGIIGLIYWRWKKGAPPSKIKPDTVRMAEPIRREMKPVSGFDVARHTESEVSTMKTTTFMGPVPHEVENEKPVKRETSLRRKVVRPPAQRLPARAHAQRNAAYERSEDEEEEDNESVVSASGKGSREALVRKTKKEPALPIKAPIRGPEPPEMEDESEEVSEEEEEETESDPESVRRQPNQVSHSAAQVPTVAVMSEASGPPRYPPVRFRSSVHPAPSLPPLDTKNRFLVGVKIEPPSEDEAPRRRRKQPITRKELDKKADLERQKNKQRLRDRKRDTLGRARPENHMGVSTWEKAQQAIDDVLEGQDAEPIIMGRKPRTLRHQKRPPSSSVATDDDRAPKLKSYKKLKSPKMALSSGLPENNIRDKSTDSVTNASSDESEIDMNETRRRMHQLLDNAFSLFGPTLSKGMPPQPEEQPQYPNAPSTRPAPPPRYLTGQPALPEPSPAHGRATEPTPGQRRRIATSTPGYPGGMPLTPIGVPGYPTRTPERPLLTRDPVVVWDPAERQRIIDQRAPPPTYAYRDPSGQNVYITPVQQQRDGMGDLVWSPYAAEDTMDAIYPDLAQANYPGVLGTSPPKNSSFLSTLQATPHDTLLNMSSFDVGDHPRTPLGQSPQPLIRSIKDELYRLSQGASRKTPIKEL